MLTKTSKFTTFYLELNTSELLESAAKQLTRQGIKGLYLRNGKANKSAVVRYLIEQAAKHD